MGTFELKTKTGKRFISVIFSGSSPVEKIHGIQRVTSINWVVGSPAVQKLTLYVLIYSFSVGKYTLREEREQLRTGFRSGITFTVKSCQKRRR